MEGFLNKPAIDNCPNEILAQLQLHLKQHINIME